MAETAIFLPVALLVMFAIIFFGRFGVLEERAQSAVRYGATVSYDPATHYRAADIYTALAANAAPSGMCPATVATDTKSVLNGGQSAGATQGFFKPDRAAAATCTVATAGFTSTATDAFRYVTVTSHTATGNLDVPPLLSGLSGVTGNVSASLGFAHTDAPATILYCTAHVGASVAAALNATYTATGNC